jgi:hypothetical protein
MERAATPVTDLAKLDRWCQILRIAQEHLWFTLSEQRSDPYAVGEATPTLPSVDAATGDDVQRRQFLKSAGVAVAVGTTILETGSVAGAAATESKPRSTTFAR